MSRACISLYVLLLTPVLGGIFVGLHCWLSSPGWLFHDPRPHRMALATLRPEYKSIPYLSDLDQAYDARIVPHLTSPTWNLPEHTIWTRLTSRYYGYDTRNPAIQLPAYVFSTDTTRLGRCWEVGAEVAQIGVRFDHEFRLNGMALYHPGTVFLPSDALASLPRILQVWVPANDVTTQSGALASHLNLPVQDFVTETNQLRDHFVLLAELEYHSHPSLATYLVYSLREASDDIAQIKRDSRLILRATHNWGANTTCWYRVAIHGHEGF